MDPVSLANWNRRQTEIVTISVSDRSMLDLKLKSLRFLKSLRKSSKFAHGYFNGPCFTEAIRTEIVTISGESSSLVGYQIPWMTLIVVVKQAWTIFVIEIVFEIVIEIVLVKQAWGISVTIIVWVKQAWTIIVPISITISITIIVQWNRALTQVVSIDQIEISLHDVARLLMCLQ